MKPRRVGQGEYSRRRVLWTACLAAACLLSLASPARAVLLSPGEFVVSSDVDFTVGTGKYIVLRNTVNFGTPAFSPGATFTLEQFDGLGNLVYSQSFTNTSPSDESSFTTPDGAEITGPTEIKGYFVFRDDLGTVDVTSIVVTEFAALASAAEYVLGEQQSLSIGPAQGDPVPVPEPRTIVLLMSAIGCMMLVRRRARQL
jgi:hypothetical protein